MEQVAADLVGLHSTDPATVYLSLWARLDDFTRDQLDDALYERRSLLRMLAMRRTMFVVPLDLAAVMDASCTPALARVERRKVAAMLPAAGIVEDPERWLARTAREVVDALHEHGPLPASRLTKIVPDLARQVPMAVGKAYEGTVGVSTRLLFLLSTEGVIARGRPLGTWLSSQYRWAVRDEWIGPLAALPPAAAAADLVRRWLGAYGPGTTDDIAWWTKWTKADVKAALGAVGAVEVTADVGDGVVAPAWVLPDDVDPPPARPRRDERVTLLPSLDPTIMGWQQRGWYLGPHRAALFDRNGNAGPTIWLGGRAVGGWAQLANGEVVTRLLEPVSARDEGRVAATAARLTAWMGGVRVTPRFPTPLGKELSGMAR